MDGIQTWFTSGGPGWPCDRITKPQLPGWKPIPWTTHFYASHPHSPADTSHDRSSRERYLRPVFFSSFKSYLFARGIDIELSGQSQVAAFRLPRAIDEHHDHLLLGSL